MKVPVLVIFGTSVKYITDTDARSRTYPEGTDMARAVVEFISEGEAKPTELHLLYSSSLLIFGVECADKLSRSKVKANLSLDHKQLTAPNAYWSLTKPFKNQEGKLSAVLHYEATDALSGILASLAELQIRVFSVLPPAAFLTAKTRSNGLDLALLAMDGWQYVYYVNELNIVAVRFVRSAAAVSEFLGNALASRKQPPNPANVLVVTDEGTLPAAAVDALSRSGLTPAPITWEAFVRPLAFSAKDPANLYVRPFRWTTAHSLYALSCVFFALAVNFGLDYASAYRRALGEARDSAKTEETLKSELTALRETQKAITANESFIASVPTANPSPVPLLDFCASKMPSTMALRQFSYERGNFALQGETQAEGSGTFESFVHELVNTGRWQLVSTPTLTPIAWSFTCTFAKAQNATPEPATK